MSKSVGYRSVNILNKLPNYVVDSGKKQEAVYRKTEKCIIPSIILFCKCVIVRIHRDIITYNIFMSQMIIVTIVLW